MYWQVTSNQVFHLSLCLHSRWIELSITRQLRWVSVTSVWSWELRLVLSRWSPFWNKLPSPRLSVWQMYIMSRYSGRRLYGSFIITQPVVNERMPHKKWSLWVWVPFSDRFSVQCPSRLRSDAVRFKLPAVPRRHSPTSMEVYSLVAFVVVFVVVVMIAHSKYSEW